MIAGIIPARRASLVLPLLVTASLLSSSGVASAKSTTKRLVAKELTGVQPSRPKKGRKGPLSAAQRRAMTQGYLVADQARYQRLKAKAQEKGGKTSHASSGRGRPPLEGLLRRKAPQRHTPTLVAGSVGLTDSSLSPSDSTSAVGPDRYVELVNARFAIYQLGGTSPLGQGTLAELTDTTAGGNVFDPQVIWDPDTSRFFYAADVVFSSTDNRLAFGWSKTATPSSAADFCRYDIPTASRFEDYPKLGDTRNRLLIGSNGFGPSDFLGADLHSITKPPAGTDCPAADTLHVGAVLNLPGAFTPVPANQTDGSTTGYVTSIPQSLPANQLLLYEVSEVGNTVNLTLKPLTVPAYDVPANAQQPRTFLRLDTLDGRDTQAVSAVNPSRSGQVSLWTQHTIFGGGGAQVRWYEINPTAPSVLQSQDLGAAGIYFFNASISPDRAVNGSTSLFGDTMLLGTNFSSSQYSPGLVLEQKSPSSPAAFAVYQLSGGPLTSTLDCAGFVCRWGDYSGMTPYPATPSGAGHGAALHTTQYVRQTGGSASGWGTVNLFVYASP